MVKSDVSNVFKYQRVQATPVIPVIDAMGL
jgi:hypothetical protein